MHIIWITILCNTIFLLPSYRRGISLNHPFSEMEKSKINVCHVSSSIILRIKLVFRFSIWHGERWEKTSWSAWNSGNAFPCGRSRPGRPLGTASRPGMSRVSRNLASCAESWESAPARWWASRRVSFGIVRVWAAFGGGASTRERKPNNADD